MKNVIKRNTISITGTADIRTNATEQGDEIHATKTNDGWTVLNYRTGEYYQCFPDFLRRFVTITEQIAQEQISQEQIEIMEDDAYLIDSGILDAAIAKCKLA